MYPSSGISQSFSYQGCPSYFSFSAYCQSTNFKVDERVISLIDQFIKPSCEGTVFYDLFVIVKDIEEKLDITSEVGQHVLILQILMMQKEIDLIKISTFLHFLETRLRKDVVNYQWEDGRTFLHRAIFQKELVEILIHAGAENISDTHGHTPLHNIDKLSHHQKEICELLLLGLDPEVKKELVNRRTVAGRTILDSAIAISNSECVRILLEAGAEIDTADSGVALFQTALFCKAQKEICTLLLSHLEPKKRKEFVNYKNVDGVTIFHLAIWSKANVEVIALLLEAGFAIQEMAFYIKASLLHAACYSLPVFTLLYHTIISNLSPYERGKIINCRCKNRQTILHIAVICRFEKNILLRLISDGAIHVQDEYGKTPFHYLTFNEKTLENLSIMLSMACNYSILNIEDNEGRTVLINAANAIASPSIIKNLKIYGANADLSKCGGDKGLTKLHYAVLTEAPLETFIKIFKDVDPSEAKEWANRKDYEGFTALHYAVNRKIHLDIVNFLLKVGASVDCQSNIGFTPLHSAARGNAPEHLQLLLHSIPLKEERIRVVNIKDNYGNNAFCCAALSKFPSYLIFQILLTNGSTTEELTSLGLTKLHIAALRQEPKARYIHILGWLDPKKRASRLNKQDVFGHTFLHKAILCHVDSKIINMLVGYGAVYVRDQEGRNPFHYIDTQNPNESQYFTALLDKLDLSLCHQLLNEQDVNGQTVLHKAIIEGAAPEVITILMQYGAHNIPDKEGRLPLHYVRNTKNASETYKLLLEGCDQHKKKVLLNAQDENGQTPLHKAIIHKIEPELITKLIQYGAENIQDKRGLTPLLLVNSTKKIASKLYTALLFDLDVTRRQRILNCPINEHNKTTVLISAIKAKASLDVISLLVTLGANVKDALYYAILQESSVEVYRALLENVMPEQRDVALNTKNHKNCMALHVMVHFFNYEVFQLLLSYGMKVNVQDEVGNTPLHIAKHHHFYSIIEHLLANGADPSMVNHKNEKALPNLEQVLIQGNKVKQKWRRLSSHCDELGRVIDCSYRNKNIDKAGTTVILQAAYDRGKCFSMYPTKIDYNVDRLVTATDNYKSTLLKVVNDANSSIAALQEVEGLVSRLFIECHGPGSDLDYSPSLFFGDDEKTQLALGNKEWLETLCTKLTHDAVVVFYSCGLGREEMRGINLCQEIAYNVKGCTVIASDKSFRGSNSAYIPDQSLDMRFFSDDGEELTVVFQEKSRVRHFRYLEKEVIEDYFNAKP